jgi:hypothetical protein
LQNWGNAGSHLHVHLPAIHAYAYSDCYSHRDCCESDPDPQTNACSKTPYDAEAAPESAAAPGGDECY